MKTKNVNFSGREILLSDREATLARLVAEMLALRRLVRLEEMMLAGETATVGKKADQPEGPIMAGPHRQPARAPASTPTHGRAPCFNQRSGSKDSA
jgi:hypothetical protein